MPILLQASAFAAVPPRLARNRMKTTPQDRVRDYETRLHEVRYARVLVEIAAEKEAARIKREAFIAEGRATRKAIAVTVLKAARAHGLRV